MVSDEERREVAERLRGLRRDANSVTQLNHGPTWSLAWCVLGDGLDECGTGDWFERMCARLADLIDPGDTSLSCRDTVACDREALLALADKMSRYASLRKSHGMDVDTMAVMAWVHRIREALGVQDA